MNLIFLSFDISFIGYLQKNFISLILLVVLVFLMFIEARKENHKLNIPFIHIVVIFFAYTIIEYIEGQLHPEAGMMAPTLARKILSFLKYVLGPGLIIFAIPLFKKNLTVKEKLITWMPSIVNLCIYSTCFFSPLTFDFTADNGFARGPWGYTFLAITIANLIIVVISFIVEYRKLSAKELFVLVLIAVIIVASSVMDSVGIVPGCTTPVVAASCLIYYLYLMIVDQKIASLEQNLETLEIANKSKTVFLNSISHDIRTPMNAIIGFTNLSKENINNKEVIIDYLDKISLSSEHLLRLINNVLEMSRIESGTIVLANEGFSITSIINNIKAINSNEVEKRNIKLKTLVTIKNDNVLGDPVRVSQILMNLVSNAIKFTRDNGTINLSVDEIVTDPVESTYQFIIKDNGIGMSKKFMEKLFMPFEQERSSTVSGIQGTGLGLSITKSLIDVMNGTITVDSLKNIGTSFIVTLKFRRDLAISKPKEQNIEELKALFKGKRLLLVEDNELNMQIAYEILRQSGFEIEMAVNGQEAVEMVKSSQPFDLILMDIQMPVMDGYEATRLIRSLDDIKKNTPIIATTANAFIEDKIEAFRRGMDGYILKPIEIDQLYKVLAQCITTVEQDS